VRTLWVAVPALSCPTLPWWPHVTLRRCSTWPTLLESSLIAIPTSWLTRVTQLTTLNPSHSLWALESAVVESWACDTDGVIGGESTATLQYDQDQHATFEGVLSTAIPAGGKVKQSGYCLIRSPESTVRVCLTNLQ
jgi:hypothetical protein